MPGLRMRERILFNSPRADGPTDPSSLSRTTREGALDKSEGLVKDKVSLAMRKHRDDGPTSVPTKTLESIPNLNHLFVERFWCCFCFLPFHQPSIRPNYG